MIVVAIIGILAAVAIPQYQNYIAKTQVSRVMAETGALRTAIESAILEGANKSKLETLRDATGDDESLGWTGSTLIDGDIVFDGEVDGDDGLKVTATFGDKAAATIDKKTLTWLRNKYGSWTCSTTVDARYAPAGCSSGS